MRRLWGETWALSDSWSSWCVLVKVWLLNTCERQMLMCVIRTDDQGEWRCTSVLMPVSPNSLCEPFKSRQTRFNSVLSSIYCHLNRACSQLSPFTFNCAPYLHPFLSFFLSFFLSNCLSVIASVYLSVYMYIVLSFCLSFYDCIFLSVRPSVRPSVHPSVRPSIRPSIHPSIHPSKPSVCLFACLFLSRFLANSISWPSLCETERKRELTAAHDSGLFLSWPFGDLPSCSNSPQSPTAADPCDTHQLRAPGQLCTALQLNIQSQQPHSWLSIGLWAEACVHFRWLSRNMWNN